MLFFSCYITTLRSQRCVKRKEPKNCFRVLREPASGGKSMGTSLEKCHFMLFLRLTVILQVLAKLGHSYCSVLKQWCQKFDERQWRVVVRQQCKLWKRNKPISKRRHASVYWLDTTLVDEKLLFFWRFLETTHGVRNLGKTVCNFDIEC